MFHFCSFFDLFFLIDFFFLLFFNFPFQVRTPTEEMNEEEELRRRAIDVHMYVTTNLKSVVWRSTHASSTYSVPMSDVTGEIFFFFFPNFFNNKNRN